MESSKWFHKPDFGKQHSIVRVLVPTDKKLGNAASLKGLELKVTYQGRAQPSRGAGAEERELARRDLLPVSISPAARQAC